MIRLTIHAARREREYNLDRSWIEAAVIAPDWTAPDPREAGITRALKAIPERGGRVLRVAHRLDGPDVLVLSAFFDRGAKP
jgi:hypothetical protein